MRSFFLILLMPFVLIRSAGAVYRCDYHLMPTKDALQLALDDLEFELLHIAEETEEVDYLKNSLIVNKQNKSIQIWFRFFGVHSHPEVESRKNKNRLELLSRLESGLNSRRIKVETILIKMANLVSFDRNLLDFFPISLLEAYARRPVRELVHHNGEVNLKILLKAMEIRYGVRLPI